MVEVVGVSSDCGDGLHVTFWDYDGEWRRDFEDSIFKLCMSYGLMIFVFSTTHGFHFVDFVPRKVEIVDSIQGELSLIFPANYPTVLEVKREILDSNKKNSIQDEFTGATLRVSGESISRFKMFGALQHGVSSSHVELYSLVTRDEIGFLSKKKTFLKMVGYKGKEDYQDGS